MALLSSAWKILLVALGLALATACASAPDTECIHRCDVDWEACTMRCEREKVGCDEGCGERPACLERCAAAHPLERARCDELHRGCLDGCSGG